MAKATYNSWAYVSRGLESMREGKIMVQVAKAAAETSYLIQKQEAESTLKSVTSLQKP